MSAAGVIRSRSPQDPSTVVGEWPDEGPDAVGPALDRAAAGLPGWAGAGPAARCGALADAADRLEARADELAALVVREVGKPLGEARGEVARTVSILRYYAQAAFDASGEVFPAPDGASLLLSRRRPRGVVALVTPWNFPLAIPTWKMAPALTWGNAVVLKPSSDGMACAEALASCFDLPPGMLQVLHGRGSTGARLADHPGVKALSFTGSTSVGRQLIATCAANGIAVQAEMGGSNAVVVLPDADLEVAAATVAGAAMAFAGQKCTATSRIVTVGVGDEFREALVGAVRALRVGDPAEPDTVVGPVIGEEPRRSVIEAAEDARDRGGRILAGGGEVDGEGWFVQPTVVDGVPPDAELAREEVFGPVCAVFDARDDDEAVAIANSTRYGLVAALHTRDLDRALRISERLDAGMLRVNAPTTGVDFHAPFGGAAGSSYGPREQGRAAREFYTTTATVTLSPSRSDST